MRAHEHDRERDRWSWALLTGSTFSLSTTHLADVRATLLVICCECVCERESVCVTCEIPCSSSSVYQQPRGAASAQAFPLRTHTCMCEHLWRASVACMCSCMHTLAPPPPSSSAAHLSRSQLRDKNTRRGSIEILSKVMCGKLDRQTERCSY